MFNRVSALLRSAWEIAGQLPMVPGRAGEEPEQKKAVALAWATLPNIQIADQWVPQEVIQLIFRKLTPEHMFKVRMVCKLWCQMAEQYLTLPKLFPDAPVLNREVWERHIDLEKHGLVFEQGKEPPLLTAREYIETERMASEVEAGKGITILTLPKGLTLNKVIAFAEAPKLGNSTKIVICSHRIIELYGDKEIAETVTVVVTNGVFNKSRNIDVAAQEALVRGLKCEMPELVPFFAHIILSFIRSDANAPLKLFGSETYTRFSEKIEVFKLQGGGFAWRPFVSFINIVDEYYGVGGQRKFPAIKSVKQGAHGNPL